MKVTKQQKILGGVLAIGALAMMCDRLFVLKPQATPTPDAATEYALAAPATPSAISAAPAVSVAQRLRDAASRQTDNTLRDAFVLGPAWPTPEPLAVEQPQVQKRDTAQFSQSHRLTGVVSSAGVSHAMVDGTIVSVGQMLDGYRLISISHRSATFESDNVRVILNMSEGSGQGAVAGAGQ